ncbi:MAG TPA: isoaspartyl peptidase/L-asparaginase [Gemmataceae bacterium]|nr:isoaspartyl peptidase/L-asparaginase [Gemmataceae bacterium]
MKVVLVMHGGAGVPAKMSPALVKKHEAVLAQALRTGYAALQKPGGTSVDAVEAAIRVLEDSPLFNAGKGAVFNHDGRNELDAAIMEGKEHRAGAVANVHILKNPISAARAVMEHSKHVLLVGRGAELFATTQGCTVVDPSYFWTKERWRELQRALEEEKKGHAEVFLDRRHFGTVGALALDREGNLAAGTSTGGLTNKRFGRVGDSPLIGAGTYADNATCAVSGTGHGEVFIRYTVAADVAARIRYGKQSLREAAQAVLDGLPKEPGGVGGLIALDRRGHLAMPYNTDGMFRGYVTSDGKVYTATYGSK